MAGIAVWRGMAVVLAGWLLAAGPAMAQTMPAPSFDCATADHYVEWGICHDADLARLDAAIGRRLEFLLDNLDPVAAEALRKDQALYLEDRNSFIGGTLKGEWVDAMKEDIEAKLVERLEELEAIEIGAAIMPPARVRPLPLPVRVSSL